MTNALSADAPGSRRAGVTLTQSVVFLVGFVALVTMAFMAHSLPYFPGDITISHAVQTYRSDWLDAVFAAASWTGFPPQSDVLFGVVVILLFVFVSRVAAVMEAIAAIGSGGLYLLVEQLVRQPRPSVDIVQVAGPIELTGFPSGHLATFTAVFGFLAYLAYRRLRPSTSRWLPVGLVIVALAVMSIARIYSGQHWASDVIAGCLLGALWLTIVIQLSHLVQGRMAPRSSVGAAGPNAGPPPRDVFHPKSRTTGD
jgi:undecaprenyl-diphosphatase